MNNRRRAPTPPAPAPFPGPVSPRSTRAPGVPLSWNPARNPRGVGAEALLATPAGLYVGSDTEYIGNRQYLRQRLAYFPLAGGTALPIENTGTLPTNVYLAGRSTATATTGTNDVRARFYTGTTVGTDVAVDAAGLEWSRARGALHGRPHAVLRLPNAAGIYYLYRRTFDGVAFGPATAIDPYNDPFWSTIATGSLRNNQPILYRGALPAFYSQLSPVTGMFYRDGRPVLHAQRGLRPVLPVVLGRQRHRRHRRVHRGDLGRFNDVAGMFVAGNHLYWASALGATSAGWRSSTASRAAP